MDKFSGQRNQPIRGRGIARGWLPFPPQPEPPVGNIRRSPPPEHPSSRHDEPPNSTTDTDANPQPENGSTSTNPTPEDANTIANPTSEDANTIANPTSEDANTSAIGQPEHELSSIPPPRDAINTNPRQPLPTHTQITNWRAQLISRFKPPLRDAVPPIDWKTRFQKFAQEVVRLRDEHEDSRPSTQPSTFFGRPPFRGDSSPPGATNPLKTQAGEAFSKENSNTPSKSQAAGEGSSQQVLGTGSEEQAVEVALDPIPIAETSSHAKTTNATEQSSVDQTAAGAQTASGEAAGTLASQVPGKPDDDVNKSISPPSQSSIRSSQSCTCDGPTTKWRCLRCLRTFTGQLVLRCLNHRTDIAACQFCKKSRHFFTQEYGLQVSYDAPELGDITLYQSIPDELGSRGGDKSINQSLVSESGISPENAGDTESPTGIHEVFTLRTELWETMYSGENKLTDPPATENPQ